MKLTVTQVQRTLRQLDANAIPDNHPVALQLRKMFGEHTFFLDDDGLSIVEPATEMPAQADDVQSVRVIKLADWTDEDLTSLTPHEPEPTDDVIELVSLH